MALAPEPWLTTWAGRVRDICSGRSLSVGTIGAAVPATPQHPSERVLPRCRRFVCLVLHARHGTLRSAPGPGHFELAVPAYRFHPEPEQLVNGDHVLVRPGVPGNDAVQTGLLAEDTLEVRYFQQQPQPVPAVLGQHRRDRLEAPAGHAGIGANLSQGNQRAAVVMPRRDRVGPPPERERLLLDLPDPVSIPGIRLHAGIARRVLHRYLDRGCLLNEFLRGRALPRDQRVAAGRRLGLGAESGKPGD